MTVKEELENQQRDLVNEKIDDLLLNLSNQSSNGDISESNSFFEMEAEEGEEDTPSEGSNDIIDPGEEINTTESELETDESYENNSFIDDEENHELLSGDEYDLSLEDAKKPSRIIRFSSGSDDDLVLLKKKKPKEVKRKKSRIIRFEDSSDEEVTATKECVPNENGSNHLKSEDREHTITKYSGLSYDDQNETKTDTLLKKDGVGHKIIILENVKLPNYKAPSEKEIEEIITHNVNVSVTDNGNSSLVNGKTKKRKRRKNRTLEPTDNLWKNCTYESNSDTIKKKSKKRKNIDSSHVKLSKRKCVSPVFNSGSKYSTATDRTQRHCNFILSNKFLSTKEWSVDKIALTPSSSSTKPITEGKAKAKRNEIVRSTKDFKTQVLHTYRQKSRITTSPLLKKKL